MGLGPENGPSKGIVQKALRSIDPSAARNDKDANHRRRRRQALRREAIVGDEIPTEGLIPGFDQQPDVPRQKQVAFLIPEDDLKQLCEKIVRGLTFIETNRLIKSPYAVHVEILQKDALPEFEKMISRFSVNHDRGPGIVVRRAVANEDTNMSVFGISIWGKLNISAFVLAEE